MFKKVIFTIVGICFLFAGTSLTIKYNQKPALNQQLTLNRLLEAPLVTLGKHLGKTSCSIQNANADLISEHSSKDNPGDCGCGQQLGTADIWNKCLGCLFVMFVKVYNDLTTNLSQNVNPDTDTESTVNAEGTNLTVSSKASTISGYDRQVQISGTSGLCVSVYYSKNSSDSSKVKAIMHMNGGNCPGGGSSQGVEKHAMAMKFDLKYTTATLQTATFFHTGDYDTSGFSVTGNQQDDIFYMNISVDEASGKPITSAWVYRLAENSAWKFFLNGEDDVKLYIGNKNSASLSDTTVDGSDLTMSCMDDSANSSLAATSCTTTSGYAFSSFPITVNSIKSKTYPSWTASSLSVTADAGVESYF